MKGLSVTDFWNIRPKLPFRFKVDFYTGFSYDKTLSYCVTNVNLPKMEGQSTEGSMYLGNTIFTVPTWNIASRKLEITFEESDNYIIVQFIDDLLKNSYGKVPYKITIVIHEFDEKFGDKVTSTGYVCHLTSYEEPSFKRDGAAQQVSISAIFIIDTIINNWSEKNIYYKQKTQIDLDEFNNNFTDKIYGNSKIDIDEKFDVKKTNKKLNEFTSDNPNREENFDTLRQRMKNAGVDLSDTKEVIKYLMKEGYITSSYNNEINGLCATATYIVAAITSGADDLGPSAGHGQEQDLGQFGYHKKYKGTGADELNRLVESGKLKEGDVINITYADNSKYGHAVTVTKDDNGKYGFVSDFAQNSSHGQTNENRVGSWYVQRNIER